MKNIITLLLLIPFIAMGQENKRVGINTDTPLQTLDISANKEEIQKIPNGSSVPDKLSGTLAISDTDVPLTPSDPNDENSEKTPVPVTALGWIPAVDDNTDTDNGLIVQYSENDPESLPKGINTLTLSTEPGYTTEEFKPTHYVFLTSHPNFRETAVHKYIGNGDFIASNGYLLGGNTRPYMMALAVPDPNTRTDGVVAYPIYLDGGSSSNLTYVTHIAPKENSTDRDFRSVGTATTTNSITGRLGFSYPICITYKLNGQWHLYADLPYTFPMGYNYVNVDTGELIDNNFSDRDFGAMDLDGKFKWFFNGVFIRQDYFGDAEKAGYKEITIDLSDSNYYNSINGDFKQ